MLFRKRKTGLAAFEAEPADPYGSPRLGPRSPSEALKPTMPPPPPPARPRRRRGGLLSTLSAMLTLAVIVSIAGLIATTSVDRQATAPGPLSADKVVLIPRNTGTAEIAALLRREGVISQALLFEYYALMNRSRGQLKAGEFLFKAGTSVDGAIETLTSGRAIQHAVTLPEGLTTEQIVQRLRDHELLAGEITEMPREGSLLPDTYKFERGTTRQQILNQMALAQRNVLNQVWTRRSPELPIRSPQELVTLASVVEKETGRADERPHVAGVFVNRLQRRMKLQSDPTIVYGLVGGKGTLGRGILRSEIERPTPYNTYVIEGLPPGPIANPGRAALEAAANPVKTKDIFFVADGTGGHAFAETLDQHQRNVARWRQVERARLQEPAAAAPGAAPAAPPVVDRAEPPPEPAPGSPASAFAPVGDPLQAGAPRAPGAAPAPAPGNRRGGRSVDASEGTARDPLANRSFDLTSPKTVPKLRTQ